MGLSPVLYSTPDGCAALGDKGFDAVWAAVPGDCDPTSIFAATFMPGGVAVQCGSGSSSGVSFDASVSEFGFGGDMSLVGLDPNDPVVIAIRNEQAAIGGLVTDIAQEAVNGTVVGPDGVATQLPAIKAILANLQAAIAGLTPGAVDANALASALATHPLTATLSDAERDAVATHVLQHLSKDAAAG